MDGPSISELFLVVTLVSSPLVTGDASDRCMEFASCNDCIKHCLIVWLNRM